MHRIVAAADSALLGLAPREKITDKTRSLAEAAAGLLDTADHVVFCHGGLAETKLIRSVLEEAVAAGIAQDAPYDACDAMGAGFLGFNLLDAISHAVRKAGRSDALPAAAVLTQIIPDGTDLPAVIEDAAIRTLSDSCAFLIAGGSGGLPVEWTEDGLTAIEDSGNVHLTSAAIADLTEADCLVAFFSDSTELPEGPFDADSAEEAAQGANFTSAVRSALHAASLFVGKKPGRRALLAHIGSVQEAVAGKSGTQIAQDPQRRS